MRTFLRRPARGSVSGMVLARELGVPAIRRRGSRYRYRPGDTIINWGCSEALPDVPDGAYINTPQAVALAIDKRASWLAFREAGVPTVTWTSSVEEATAWIRDGGRVLVRTSLRGSQGRGISVYSEEGTKYTNPLPLPEGATYVKCHTRNPKDTTEYRIHVMHGQVIDVVQKKRRRDYDEERFNPYIRSHGNEWIFARDEIERSELAEHAAVCAVDALGLDFGAADVGSGDGRACVYEVNSAPGLEGTTLRRYAGSLELGV